MERYTHQQNLAHYRRLLAESERDPARWPMRKPKTPSRKTVGISLRRPLADAITS